MKSFLIRKVRLAFRLALFTLLVMGLFTYHWMVVSDESDNWARHSHDVLMNIQDLSLAMESIESTSRGFVLTGKESYRANIARIAQDQAAIRTLTLDNAAQQIHFPDLEVLAAERIQHVDMLIDLRRTQGQAAAVAAFGGAPDKQGSEFRVLVNTILNAELRLQTQRVEATKQYVIQTKLILLFGSLMGLVIVSAAAWFAVRDSSTREAAEARYRGLMEAAPDGMVVVDRDGEIVLLNVQAEKQFGYRSDELLGQKVTNIIPEGFAERLIADGTRTTAEALAQQIGTGIELHGRRKDGSEFPIEIMLSPLESADGILVTAAIRNITVRKDADKDTDRVLIQKTIEMAHDLGMKVTGEGVETREQLEFLRISGCDGVQGYLFSRPLSLHRTCSLASYTGSTWDFQKRLCTEIRKAAYSILLLLDSQHRLFSSQCETAIKHGHWGGLATRSTGMRLMRQARG